MLEALAAGPHAGHVAPVPVPEPGMPVPPYASAAIRCIAPGSVQIPLAFEPSPPPSFFCLNTQPPVSLFLLSPLPPAAIGLSAWASYTGLFFALSHRVLSIPLLCLAHALCTIPTPPHSPQP